MNLENIDLSKYIDLIIEGAITYTPKVIGALLTLWIGFKLIKVLDKLIDKGFTKAKIDKALKNFIKSLISSFLKVMLLLTVAGMIGIQTTSFIALIGAAGLAFGMALSGTLQNFAGGVMILFFKPFKIGDWVEVSGYAGSIEEIHIFNTYLLTGDRKTIIIPNSDISNSSLINYSAHPKRRIDYLIGVGYNDDIDKVKKVLLSIAKAEKRILQKEKILVGVKELADNSVNFAFRFFVKSEDYWSVYYDTLETVKKTFDKEGISFPFPQRDVHIFNEK